MVEDMVDGLVGSLVVWLRSCIPIIFLFRSLRKINVSFDLLGGLFLLKGYKRIKVGRRRR